MQHGKDFVKAIGALSPHGGGDCLELTFRGIIDALNAHSRDGSPLYVFTDDTAKDSGAFNTDMARIMALLKGTNDLLFYHRTLR